MVEHRTKNEKLGQGREVDPLDPVERASAYRIDDRAENF